MLLNGKHKLAENSHTDKTIKSEGEKGRKGEDYNIRITSQLLEVKLCEV